MYLSNYFFFIHAKNSKCDWRALGLSLLGYLLDWNIILIFEFVHNKKINICFENKILNLLISEPKQD